jgi:zona occludens toxin (predicted ATPase)
VNERNGRLRRTAHSSTAILCLGLLATPAIAATSVPPPTAPRPLSTSARERVARMDLSGAAQAGAATGTTDSTTGEKSFFKSGKGVLAVVLLAGAVGYTVYSAHHNRVRSPIR